MIWNFRPTLVSIFGCFMRRMLYNANNFRGPWCFFLLLAALIFPWVSVLIASAPILVGTFFLVMLAVSSGLGYLLLRPIICLERYPFTLLLVPAAGHISMAAVITFGLRTGLGAALMFWICVAIGILGLGLLLIRLRDHRIFQRSFNGGYRYFLLSIIICSVYFLPPAFREAVILPDGTFQWLYVDQQYHMAVAAAIKTADGRPRMPGMHEAELYYHFGADAISGALSAALPVSLAHSYARVLRGLTQFTLMVGCLGLGFVLVRVTGFPPIAALGSPILMFFYGSLSALFSPIYNSSTTFNDPVLFNLPLSVLVNGGPFLEIILGTATAHGLIGLTLTLALAISLITPKCPWLKSLVVVAIIPGMLVPLNLIIGIAATGLLVVAFIIRAPTALRSWLLALTAFGCTTAGYAAMGFLGAGITQLQIDPVFYREIPGLIIWFLVGLGARTILFSPALASYSFGIRLLLGLLFFGFLSLTVLFYDPFWGNDRYGIYFLQSSISMLAGPLLVVLLLTPLSGTWVRVVDTARLLLKGTGRIAVLLTFIAAFGLTAVWIYGLFEDIELVYGFKISLLVGLAAAIASLTGLRLFALKIHGLKNILAIAVLAIYATGFLAWFPDWLNFGFDRAQVAVRLPPQDVAGLSKIASLAEPGTLIATNQHSIPSIPKRPERSYGYFALIERPILLEGWQYTEYLQSIFSTIERDNTTLFTTKDQAEFRMIVERYGIDFIVARPETDIALPIPRPSWLCQLDGTGSLTVYQVME